MLPCTSRNNMQALVLAGAARGALQSRVPARARRFFPAAAVWVCGGDGEGGGGQGRGWRRQRRRWRRWWSRRLLRRRRARRRRSRRRRRRRGRLRRERWRRREGGQLQEARVGLERGAVLDEWPVLLVMRLEGSSAPSALARSPICRLRGLPQDGLELPRTRFFDLHEGTRRSLVEMTLAARLRG